VIPDQYQLCEDTGRIDNFRWASGKKQGNFQGWFFNDSDVYKQEVRLTSIGGISEMEI